MFARFLERGGLLERDAGNSYLVFAQRQAGAVRRLFGHSMTDRIAYLPYCAGSASGGAKVFTWQTVPPRARGDDSAQAAQVAGFSRPAGAMAEPHRRDKRGRLCRYSSRPAVSEKRLALTASAKIHYPLKTPYREGTTQVMFEPVDFIAALRCKGRGDGQSRRPGGEQHNP